MSVNFSSQGYMSVGCFIIEGEGSKLEKVTDIRICQHQNKKNGKKCQHLNFLPLIPPDFL